MSVSWGLNRTFWQVALVAALLPVVVHPAPTNHAIGATIDGAIQPQPTNGAASWGGAGKRYKYSAESTLESTSSASVYIDATVSSA